MAIASRLRCVALLAGRRSQAPSPVLSRCFSSGKGAVWRRDWVDSDVGAGTQAGGAAGPKKKFKVCVSGGAGGIGQPLSMLMTLNNSVGELSIQDVSMAMVPPAGVAADL